jgi:hypothetical protein
MPVDERRRHGLYEVAKRDWGEEHAATLMELLPPVGWGDVATKRDLDQLRDQLTDRLTASIREAENRMIRWAVTTMLAGMGLAFVAAQFA